MKSARREKVALCLSWAFVAVPALWGIWRTVLQALELFR